MIELEELAARFLTFAATSASRAPLYRRLSEVVADDPELLGILQDAPDEQAVPVLLFAAIHHLVLDPSSHPDGLAAWYPTVAPEPRTDDPARALRTFVQNHADRLRGLVAVRHTQTNEVGRSALMVPAFALVADDVARPLALVEVGASAGLNLMIDRYGYDYEPGGSVGDASALRLTCATRGTVPVPPRLPPICAAVGLDAQPIDLSDPDDVRWLRACVWPDQLDRFHRLSQALDLARAAPPTVRAGDAVDDLVPTVRGVLDAGHPVVVTSWVLSYLSLDRQRAFVSTLEALATETDLSWVSLESPAQTPGLPIPARHEGEDLTVLGLTRWRDGTRSVRRLATCHPHGYWMQWEETDG